MGKKLSRIRARVCIVLFAIGIAGLLGSMVSEGWALTIAGVGFCVAAMLVRPWGCPSCGRKISPMPQWSQPGKYHCSYCGSRLAYDDEKDSE